MRYTPNLPVKNQHYIGFKVRSAYGNYILTAVAGSGMAATARTRTAGTDGRDGESAHSRLELNQI